MRRSTLFLLAGILCATQIVLSYLDVLPKSPTFAFVGGLSVGLYFYYESKGE